GAPPHLRARGKCRARDRRQRFGRRTHARVRLSDAAVGFAYGRADAPAAPQPCAEPSGWAGGASARPRPLQPPRLGPLEPPRPGPLEPPRLGLCRAPGTRLSRIAARVAARALRRTRR